MKACPYCAEEIQDAAIVCRYCGRELDPEGVVQVQQSRSGSTLQGATSEPPPPPIETQTRESSRTGSLILGSILIGAAIAALAAIPRVLDVLEAIQAAANDPSAIPLMRMLEQDLAIHFITNLVIYSVIGGVIIWGWRRNRNLTLSLLGAAAIVIVVLTVFGSGELDQPVAPSAARIPTSKPSGISAGGSNIFITPTAIPSGISAGGSDFFDDSGPASLETTVNYACQCPAGSETSLNSAPKGSSQCYSVVISHSTCDPLRMWGPPGSDCLISVEEFGPIWARESDCPGCVNIGKGIDESPAWFSHGAKVDVTGQVQGYTLVTTNEWATNGLVNATFRACPVTP